MLARCISSLDLILCLFLLYLFDGPQRWSVDGTGVLIGGGTNCSAKVEQRRMKGNVVFGSIICGSGRHESDSTKRRGRSQLVAQDEMIRPAQVRRSRTIASLHIVVSRTGSLSASAVAIVQNKEVVVESGAE